MLASKHKHRHINGCAGGHNVAVQYLPPLSPRPKRRPFMVMNSGIRVLDAHLWATLEGQGKSLAATLNVRRAAQIMGT